MPKKTFIMNIVAAIGWGVVGIALFLNKYDSVSVGVLSSIIALYAVMVGVPALSARALSPATGPRLRKAMIFANGALVVLWAISTITSIYLGVGVASALAGVVAFVIPEVINIQALRSHPAASTQANPTLLQSAQVAIPRKGPPMKILIVNRKTTETVYTAEVHLQGQNYEPSNDERFSLAWKAAVEDGAVKAEERDNYAFIASGQPASGA